MVGSFVNASPAPTDDAVLAAVACLRSARSCRDAIAARAAAGGAIARTSAVRCGEMRASWTRVPSTVAVEVIAMPMEAETERLTSSVSVVSWATSAAGREEATQPRSCASTELNRSCRSRRLSFWPASTRQYEPSTLSTACALTSASTVNTAPRDRAPRVAALSSAPDFIGTITPTTTEASVSRLPTRSSAPSTNCQTNCSADG
mmetsp:Transcript_60377/g.134562  ORF Transcript_60377/g.134562 Transcript_60377/m.134562 type:complete len:204 (+) Transcript_60377:490-1101(+)